MNTNRSCTFEDVELMQKHVLYDYLGRLRRLRANAGIQKDVADLRKGGGSIGKVEKPRYTLVCKQRYNHKHLTTYTSLAFVLALVALLLTDYCRCFFFASI